LDEDSLKDLFSRLADFAEVCLANEEFLLNRPESLSGWIQPARFVVLALVLG
jgi:hypothetical protein